MNVGQPNSNSGQLRVRHGRLALGRRAGSATKPHPPGEPALTTTLKEQYVWSQRYIDSPVLRDRDADGNAENGLEEPLYYLTDANYNVTALVDASGAVQVRYVYDPYGVPTWLKADWSAATWAESKVNKILFQGMYYDTETGLYHVRHRMYHPTLGRWLQRDPLGYVDGMGLYEFEGGNPACRTDSSGLSDIWEGVLGWLEMERERFEREAAERLQREMEGQLPHNELTQGEIECFRDAVRDVINEVSSGEWGQTGRGRKLVETAHRYLKGNDFTFVATSAVRKRSPYGEEYSHVTPGDPTPGQGSWSGSEIYIGVDCTPRGREAARKSPQDYVICPPCCVVNRSDLAAAIFHEALHAYQNKKDWKRQGGWWAPKQAPKQEEADAQRVEREVQGSLGLPVNTEQTEYQDAPDNPAYRAVE